MRSLANSITKCYHIDMYFNIVNGFSYLIASHPLVKSLTIGLTLIFLEFCRENKNWCLEKTFNLSILVKNKLQVLRACSNLQVINMDRGFLHSCFREVYNDFCFIITIAARLGIWFPTQIWKWVVPTIVCKEREIETGPRKPMEGRTRTWVSILERTIWRN